MAHESCRCSFLAPWALHVVDIVGTKAMVTLGVGALIELLAQLLDASLLALSVVERASTHGEQR